MSRNVIIDAVCLLKLPLTLGVIGFSFIKPVGVIFKNANKHPVSSNGRVRIRMTLQIPEEKLVC